VDQGIQGGELLRLVINHPALELNFVYSTTRPGFAISDTHPDLLGTTSMNFTDQVNLEVDVVFLCLGHGNSSKFLEQKRFSDQTIIIDLSNDFRLSSDSEFMGRKFIYGLPELNKEAIEQTNAIANPGCFATCNSISITSFSKRKISFRTVFTLMQLLEVLERVLVFLQLLILAGETITYPGTNPLRTSILERLMRTIETLQGSKPQIHFLPHRGDFTRGIFATAYTSYEGTLEEAKELYKNYYANDPFTHVSEQEISLKQVINSNNCFIHLHLHEGTLLVTSVIDNLIKGASGQAIQNLNLIFGWEEKLGLNLKGSTF
jgi:N-acetyl-gamma-glutamyl-phosphate reductase